MIQWLGQSTTTSVVTFRNGHRYRSRWFAPVPCGLIPPPAISAAMQALGSQAGIPNPWGDIGFETVPAGLGCQISASGTWNAPDTVVDPEVVPAIPGLGAILPEEILDVTENRVVYDARSIPRPTPPGPAPAPPTTRNPPPGDAGPVTPVPATQRSVWPWIAAAGAFGVAGYVVFGEESRRRRGRSRTQPRGPYR